MQPARRFPQRASSTSAQQRTGPASAHGALPRKAAPAGIEILPTFLPLAIGFPAVATPLGSRTARNFGDVARSPALVAGLAIRSVGAKSTQARPFALPLPCARPWPAVASTAAKAAVGLQRASTEAAIEQRQQQLPGSLHAPSSPDTAAAAVAPLHAAARGGVVRPKTGARGVQSDQHPSVSSGSACAPMPGGFPWRPRRAQLRAQARRAG